jgi:hypothetical protein
MRDAETHRRWASKLPLNRDTGDPDYLSDWYWQQCGGCAFYRALSGQLGEDWGACANPASPFDARLMFEHDGCEAFEQAGPDSDASFR